MQLSRRTLLATSLLPLAVPARAAPTKGRLTFGLSAYPPSLAPFTNAGAAAATCKYLMYRGLVSWDAQGRQVSELAESWEHDGATQWKFKLRTATFHNGAPFTSADVKYTIETVAAEKSTAYLRAEFQNVVKIETPDARTVVLTTKEPIATMPMWFASPHMPMIQAGSIEAPVGCGPYVMTGQERGAWLEFEAFGKYYKPGYPKTPKLRITVYADENLRQAALESGDVDIIEYVPWQSFDAVEANPKLKLSSTVGPFMNLLFNGKTGAFKDVRLRQAAAFAIRREEIVKAVFFGRGAPLGGMPIPPGSEFFNEGRSKYWSYDPARAKKLMAEAGVGDGFACTLLANSTYGMHRDTAQVVAEHLGEIGIKVTLALPEWAQRVALGNRGQYEFAVFGTSADSNDPMGLAPVMDGELAPSYGRSANMPTPELHALFAKARAEFDLGKRAAVYAEIEQVALAQAPMVSLAWRAQAYGMAKEVQGFGTLPGALTGSSGLLLEHAYVG